MIGKRKQQESFEARADTARGPRERLDTPAGPRGFKFEFDVEAVGAFGERFARFLGTGRYLATQTIIVVIWIGINVFWLAMQFDPYPFILLNLAFSTQAAYAAPLILLAQNRQENRDRVALEEDRMRAAQTKADIEFLARELAGLRIAIGEVATRDYLRHELDDLHEQIAGMVARNASGENPMIQESVRRPKNKQKPKPSA